MSTEAELIAEVGRQGREITRLRLRARHVLDLCEQVEDNPIGWGGPMVISLARTIKAAIVTEVPADLRGEGG